MERIYGPDCTLSMLSLRLPAGLSIAQQHSGFNWDPRHSGPPNWYPGQDSNLGLRSKLISKPCRRSKVLDNQPNTWNKVREMGAGFCRADISRKGPVKNCGTKCLILPPTL